MPPKSRQGHTTNGIGLPTTPEELAQLITQHVNTAMEQREANQAMGRGRGRGDAHGFGGTQIGAQPGSNDRKSFCSFLRYDIN